MRPPELAASDGKGRKVRPKAIAAATISLTLSSVIFFCTASIIPINLSSRSFTPPSLTSISFLANTAAVFSLLLPSFGLVVVDLALVLRLLLFILSVLCVSAEDPPDWIYDQYQCGMPLFPAFYI